MWESKLNCGQDRARREAHKIYSYLGVRKGNMVTVLEVRKTGRILARLLKKPPADFLDVSNEIEREIATKEQPNV